MIMLIATVCIIIATVAAGVQAAKIRGGWVPDKFAGNAAEFLMRKRKEYAMLAWVGAVCGPLFLVIAALEWGKPGAYERVAYGVLTPHLRRGDVRHARAASDEAGRAEVKVQALVVNSLCR